MKTSFHAVLLGFNQFQDEENFPTQKYAEKDARDLHHLLIEHCSGIYASKDITLIAGHQICMGTGSHESPSLAFINSQNTSGGKINTEDIETILYTSLVKRPSSEDVILVYYSGYGFIAGDNQKSFLATPDVPILTILNNPKAGLQLDYLIRDIFMQTKARTIIFLLDCCYVGPFCPKVRGGVDIHKKRLVEDRFFSGDGRVAFISTSRELIQKENEDFQNGIFTHYLLKGLQGEALDRESREVTLGNLIPYVLAMLPVSQPVQIYGRPTQIPISRPTSVSTTISPVYEVFAKGEDLTKVTPPVSLMALSNPIEGLLGYLDRLLECIHPILGHSETLVGNRLLMAIKRSLDAEFAFVLRTDENNENRKFYVKFQSDLDVQRGSLDDYKLGIVGELLPVLTRSQQVFFNNKFGLYKPFQGHQDSGKYLVLVPFHLENPCEVLVLCGVDSSKLQYGEILGCILISLYKATGEFTSLSYGRIETTVLDDLKRHFYHIPSKIYSRRLALFNQHLNRITFSYEPVVYLGRRDLEIDSWEALARDPDTHRVPLDLFVAAELWGSEFITELDLYCLRTAITDYVQTWRRDRGNMKMDPVSVNVYPESLFNAAYKQELTRIVKDEELLKSKKLILEISEKQNLTHKGHSPLPSETDHGFLEAFVRKIHEYTYDLHIGFAIDDFGVEHSSIARLARLELDHVKIDRDILHHTHPDSTFRYVLEVVSRSHSHPIKVVVEGFDGDCNISLAELYQLGIQYVQGHLIRRASSSLKDLDQEQKDFLTRLLVAE